MPYDKIGVTLVYNFALKKLILEGGSLQVPKIGGGQRKLRGRQP